MRTHHRFRLDGVQHLRATRHGSRMPMFELTTRNQDKRIFRVWQLIGALKARGNKLAASIRRWEILNKDHALARVIIAFARVSDAMLRLKTFPGHASNAWHRAAHLFKDVFRLWIVPVQAQTVGKFLNNPEILTRLPRTIERFSADLNASIGI